jgi:hypothetical protein
MGRTLTVIQAGNRFGHLRNDDQTYRLFADADGLWAPVFGAGMICTGYKLLERDDARRVGLSDPGARA